MCKNETPAKMWTVGGGALFPVLSRAAHNSVPLFTGVLSSSPYCFHEGHGGCEPRDGSDFDALLLNSRYVAVGLFSRYSTRVIGRVLYREYFLVRVPLFMDVRFFPFLRVCRSNAPVSRSLFMHPSCLSSNLGGSHVYFPDLWRSRDTVMCDDFASLVWSASGLLARQIAA